MVKVMKIIERCHASPYGGHYGAFRTHAKIWQSGFFWPMTYQVQRNLLEDALDVRNMETLMLGMQCHSKTTSK